MYYLAERFYGQIEFVDLHGLTSVHLTPLRSELALQSRSYGLNIQVVRVLELAESREDIPVPDIVFGLGENVKPFGPQAYQTVYQQLGSAPGVSVGMGRRRVEAAVSVAQYLAVKQDLLDRVVVESSSLNWNRVLERSSTKLR